MSNFCWSALEVHSELVEMTAVHKGRLLDNTAWLCTLVIEQLCFLPESMSPEATNPADTGPFLFPERQASVFRVHQLFIQPLSFSEAFASQVAGVSNLQSKDCTYSRTAVKVA